VASDEIIACIKEPVLLLDGNFRVTMANRSAVEIAGLEPGMLAGRHFAELTPDAKHAGALLKKLMKSRQGRAAARMRFRAKEAPLFCDLRFTRIDDRFGDSMGILVIGRPAQRLDELKKQYRITDRETEVVHYVLSGMSNAMIAKTLCISERTVKAHLSSIFNKLGANNRRQMAYLLRDYTSSARLLEGGGNAPANAGHEGLRLLINRR
jgi:DNA-binding CsgD family transcriptional regulator